MYSFVTPSALNGGNVAQMPSHGPWKPVYFFRTGSSGVMEHSLFDLECDISMDLNDQVLFQERRRWFVPKVGRNPDCESVDGEKSKLDCWTSKASKQSFLQGICRQNAPLQRGSGHPRSWVRWCRRCSHTRGKLPSLCPNTTSGQPIQILSESIKKKFIIYTVHTL